ncbi:LysR family transcriptional regulator, hydrogen peroxide-inducible genes activator [bacterium A37T11]|nr:LysR family transcriptional regulator, hydrogen peroxide-inducible genes activator [bacterium A37T11]
MTLTQLEYIIAVDTYRSFVAAADKCFVTQPTLSMQVQKLEENLGVRLFDRSKQPVVPTEIGQEVIRQARITLRESQKIKELISDTKDELIGEFRIGVIPTVAPYLLPGFLGSFMNRYPALQLHIWEYTTDKIIRDIKAGQLDCGILSTPSNELYLLERPLYYETFVAYLSKESSLQSKNSVDANDILTEKLWLLNEGHCMRDQVLNICQRKRSLHPKDAFEYNTGSVETLKRMVDANAGVTILPELSISEFSSTELDNVRYFRSPEPVREISLVMLPDFLKRKAIDALEKEILQFIPKRFKEKKKKEIMPIN